MGHMGETGWVLKQGSSNSEREHRHDKHRVGFGQKYERRSPVVFYFKNRLSGYLEQQKVCSSKH